MKNLSILQNQFINNIYDKDDLAIISAIKDAKIPKEELLGIYRNNIYSSLINVLKITYPKVYKLFLENDFKELCKEFIVNNRSYSGNLDDYGENFADFLREKKEMFLSDLAKMEWLEHKSYLAKDVDKIDIISLQKIPPEKLFEVKFELHPSCFLLSSDYDLLSNKRNSKLSKRLYNFVIYRDKFDVNVKKISKSEFNFLSGIINNLTLYQIYEKYQVDIQNCLQKYISNSILVKFYIY